MPHETERGLYKVLPNLKDRQTQIIKQYILQDPENTVLLRGENQLCLEVRLATPVQCHVHLYIN